MISGMSAILMSSSQASGEVRVFYSIKYTNPRVNIVIYRLEATKNAVSIILSSLCQRLQQIVSGFSFEFG